MELQTGLTSHSESLEGIVSIGRTGELSFSVIATTRIGAVGRKATNACFTGYRYRNHEDFDGWLPEYQMGTSACAISTIKISRPWLFAAVMGKLARKQKSANLVSMGRTVIECGYTITLVQAEEMVRATEGGRDTGMRSRGWNNFCFVETGNEEDPVCVVCLRTVGTIWRPDFFFVSDEAHQSTDSRLLIRNFDESKF